MSGFISALIKQRKDAKKAQPDTNGRLREIINIIRKQNYDNGHTRPNGTRWTTALADQGYIHQIAAENYLRIPNSGVDPERAMELWMSSQIHKENILREGVEDVGFGFVQDGIYCYWIQLFGKLM